MTDATTPARESPADPKMYMTDAQIIARLGVPAMSVECLPIVETFIHENVISNVD